MIQFFPFTWNKQSIELFTIPSYFDLSSGSIALNVTMPPSLNPMITSQSFLVSFNKRLRGTLVRLIFWNVWNNKHNYHSFHVVSEVHILTLFAYSQICLIQHLADNKPHSFLLTALTIGLTQNTFLLNVEILWLGLVDVQ